VNPNRLRDVPMFRHLSKTELERVAGWLQAYSVPEGDLLVREGASAQEFFLIEDGEAAVLEDGERVAVLGPGDFFGEMSLLDGAPRSATVTAESPVQVMILTRSRFTKLLQNEPSIGIAILKQLARRIRVAGSASSG
jgi:CRP-like cAMP-binding protein